MDAPTRRSTGLTNAIRWTARIIGTLFMGVFLALFIPEWVQKGTFPVASDRIPMTVFFFLAFIGLIIAWKWEGTGGILALGSIILFTILGLQTGDKPGGTLTVTVICGIPALLFIFYWWQTRHRGHPNSKKSPTG
jgi:hypothetical protein